MGVAATLVAVLVAAVAVVGSSYKLSRNHPLPQIPLHTAAYLLFPTTSLALVPVIPLLLLLPCHRAVQLPSQLLSLRPLRRAPEVRSCAC